MSPEELANPALMSEDLSNAEAKCPRVQRLSLESGVSEKDVALFVAEFEAMRQVTTNLRCICLILISSFTSRTIAFLLDLFVVLY